MVILRTFSKKEKNKKRKKLSENQIQAVLGAGIGIGGGLTSLLSNNKMVKLSSKSPDNFKEAMKNYEDIEKAIKTRKYGKYAAAIGSSIGVNGLMKSVYDKKRESLSNNNKQPTEEEILEAEKENSKSNDFGAKVTKASLIGGGVSIAAANIAGRYKNQNLHQKLEEEASKKGIKLHKIEKRSLKDVIDDIKDYGLKGIKGEVSSYNPILDSISIKEKDTSPATLAHELGHRHYTKEKDAGKLGKWAHNNYDNKLGKEALKYELAVLSGINKANREKIGKKENKFLKHANRIVPILTDLPKLTAEALASKKGIEMLKSNGASKKDLKNARSTLIPAFGTYALGTLAKVGFNEAIKDLSYDITKKKLKKKQNKEEKEKENS